MLRKKTALATFSPLQTQIANAIRAFRSPRREAARQGVRPL